MLQPTSPCSDVRPVLTRRRDLSSSQALHLNDEIVDMCMLLDYENRRHDDLYAFAARRDVSELCERELNYSCNVATPPDLNID